MPRFAPFALLFLIALLSGCDKKTTYSDVSTQDMSPYSGEESDENKPGLEGMGDDGQGIIYF